MAKYHAHIERTYSIDFDFEEEEIEDDVSPEVAAEELASMNINDWDLDDEYIIVSESIYAE